MSIMSLEKLFKRIIIILIIFSTQQLKAQFEEKQDEYHHCFAEESSFSFGLGLPTSFELNAAGFNTRFYYNSGEKICFGPEFSYFKKDDVKLWDVDFVLHYIIETPWVGIYPVVGINYTEEIEEHHENKAEFGFLWGGGIHRNIKKITVFAEYTRVESQLRDQFITAGLMYRFKFK